MDTHLWGIDLGGTKIEGVILKSASDPEVFFRDRVPTEAGKGYDHIIGQIKKLVGTMTQFAGYHPTRIGFATPGAMIPKNGLMKNCNTTALNGMPLKKDLLKTLDCSLEIANDANCFALAETKLGVVHERFPNVKIIFGVIMGTGIGGGIILNGQVINGYHGIGGEWGHNYLNPSIGKPCFCGKTGCNESILSGPALEEFYFQESGQKRDLREIAERDEEGTDRAARKTISRLTENFGLAISVVANILDPDVFVIGGGVGNIEKIYSDGVDAVARYIFNDCFETPVVKPSLGDSAGVFGAAFLVAG